MVMKSDLRFYMVTHQMTDLGPQILVFEWQLYFLFRVNTNLWKQVKEYN